MTVQQQVIKELEEIPPEAQETILKFISNPPRTELEYGRFVARHYWNCRIGESRCSLIGDDL